MRTQFDEMMDATEALASLDEAGTEEAVQLTAEPLPFHPGEWLNKRVTD